MLLHIAHNSILSAAFVSPAPATTRSNTTKVYFSTISFDYLLWKVSLLVWFPASWSFLAPFLFFLSGVCVETRVFITRPFQGMPWCCACVGVSPGVVPPVARSPSGLCFASFGVKVICGLYRISSINSKIICMIYPSRRRPYRVECTGSLLTSEVKQHRARLVLGWGTAWEDLRVLSAFSFERLAIDPIPTCA